MMKCLITYLTIEEDELHLDECQNHSRYWGKGLDDISTGTVFFELEELTEFETGVHHASNPESNSTEAEVKTAVPHCSLLLPAAPHRLKSLKLIFLYI